MSVTKTIAGVVSLLATSLLAQDSAAIELPGMRPAREIQMGSGGAEPLWMALAGRKIQGHRAHVLVELAGPGRTIPGLRLLEPAGANLYFATLDLSSPLGSELQSGSRAALARFAVKGLRPLEEADKMPAALPQHAFTNQSQTQAGFDIYFFADTDLTQAQSDLALLGVEQTLVSEYFQRVRATLDPRLLKAVAKLDWVQYITPEPGPKKRVNNRDSAALIQVNSLQGPDYGLTGKDVVLGIVDGDTPSAHREFTGRVTNMEGRSLVGGAQTHATHVAGTIISAGEFDPALRGMAPGARLNAWHYNGDEVAKMNGGAGDVVAFNNSWGLVIDDSFGNCNDFGAYGGTERDLDRMIRERNVSVVFATGNDRDFPICSLLPQAGYYSNNRPAAAKNLIAVTASRPGGQITEFGGAGPARDGRIKPDLTALGAGVRSTTATTGATTLSGTSMSTPAVTGTIALLAERYKSKQGGERPPADLVKAILLNTAKDLGNPGPDYTYGYGLVQAVEAVKTIDDARYARDKVGAGGTKTHEFEVPAGAPALRVLLNYFDVPAAPDARSTIINHIDIELTGPGGVKALPLGLDPLRPNATAEPRAGIRDVSKQIVIDKPAAGKWTLAVKGLEVAEGEQDYAVTWTMAENPVPPCTATVSSTLELMEQPGGVVTLHVNANNHCDAWQVTSTPDWMRVVGGNQKGTGVLKLGMGEHTGDRARDVRIQVAGADVRIRQNPRCVAPVSFGQNIDTTLSTGDCLVELPGFFGSALVYMKKYEFAGVQGQRVAISMISTGGAFDPYLYLVAPGDVILQEDDDSFAPRDLSARIPFTGGYYVLPYTGTYTVWATTAVDLQTGSYTLRLEEGPALPGGGPLTPKQINSCPGQVSGELNSSSSTGGRRGDLFRTDVYQFFARMGQEITVEMPDVSFDPYVYLIGPSGNSLGAITNDGAEARRLTVTAPRTGLYSAEVSSFAPFVTGSYSLRVQGCSPR